MREDFEMGKEQGAKPVKAIKPKALKEWRERMGYNQREAAIAVGCSRAAWQQWEGGKLRIPRYIGLAIAALALGMQPYDGK
jgi:transcriptional regulator with XRE-family HTH domain